MPQASFQAGASIAATRRPANLGEYVAWLQASHGQDVVRRYPAYYNTVVAEMSRQLEASEFWQTLLDGLPEIEDAYRSSKGVALLTAERPTLATKSWIPFLEKTFRKNVVANENWPDPPDGGWLLPDNWLERVGDLVRTTIYVRYLDGVEFLSDAVIHIASEHLRTCGAALQASDEGYYAMHLDVSCEFEVPRRDWDTTRLMTTFELQVTTGVKGLIKELLEDRYRARRLIRGQDSASSKPVAWALGTDAFSLSYLGHVTHFIEEMIVRLRDKRETLP
jgi:hypothetical protein